MIQLIIIQQMKTYKADINKYEIKTFIRGKSWKNYNIKQYYDKAYTKLYKAYGVENGTIKGAENYYNENGNLEKKIYHFSDGNNKNIYYYDQLGNIIKSERIYNKSLSLQIRYIYYPNGALHKLIQMGTGKDSSCYITIEKDTFFTTEKIIFQNKNMSSIQDSQVRYKITYYYPNNKTIRLIQSYCGKELDGEYFEYHPNGIIKKRCEMINNKEHNIMCYDELGKPLICACKHCTRLHIGQKTKYYTSGCSKLGYIKCSR